MRTRDGPVKAAVTYVGILRFSVLQLLDARLESFTPRSGWLAARHALS